MAGNFDNIWKLTRSVFRREWRISLVWLAVLVVVIVGLVPGMMAIMDEDGIAELAAMVENPALVAMMGPAFAAETPGFGAVYTTMMLLFSAISVAIMNIFLITRHTRADEELGRYEVLRSLPLGRLSNLAAAFICAIAVNAAIAAFVGIGMFALGDVSMSFGGSMLWGAALGAAGLIFAGFAAIFCQLSASSRGAASYSFLTLIIFYFLRAAGDINSDMEIISWISPLGLINRTAPYAGDRWWPIFAGLGIAAIAAIIAFWLNSIRDIDQGLIPARPGREAGGRLLRSPLGLAFRLLRVSLIGALVGMFVLGASYAVVLDGIDDFLAHNQFYQDLIFVPAGIDFQIMEGMSTQEIVALMNSVVAAAGFTTADLFASMINNLMAMVALIAPISFILRARAEEKAGRAELILSTPTCKIRYLGGFAAIAFISAAILQILLALGLYVTARAMPYVPQMSLGFLLQAAMVYIPAIWAIIGIAIFILGAAPRAAAAIWGFFGYTLLITFIGRMGILPAWLPNTTPMGFVPQLPIDQLTPAPLILLTLFAAALTAAGLALYRRRDLA